MSEVTIGELLSHRILPSESDLLKTDLQTGHNLVKMKMNFQRHNEIDTMKV